MFAVGLVLPVLPQLVQSLATGGAAHGAEIYGLFNGLWAAMQFLASPLQGALSDRFGRRPVILISNFGLGADYVLLALAPSLGWLFLGRVISGAAAGSIPAAFAYLADTSKPEERAKSFGLLGAATGLGFAAGPALGGLMGHVDPRLPFWIAAGLSLLNTLYGVFVLPESLPKTRRAPFRWRHANPIGAFRLISAHKALHGMALVAFLVSLSSQALPNVVVLYAAYRYHWDTFAVGLALTGWAIGSMAAQGGLVAVAVHRLGERSTMLTGLGLTVAGFATFALAGTGPQFWVGVVMMSGGSICSPLINAFFSRRLGASEQGRLQGASTSLNGITGMIGPALFTQVFAVAIRGQHRINLIGAPFLVAAALVGCAAIIAARETAHRRP